MTYGHLHADCLYTGISSGPNARYRVWEAFTLYLFLKTQYKDSEFVDFLVLTITYRSELFKSDPGATPPKCATVHWLADTALLD